MIQYCSFPGCTLAVRGDDITFCATHAPWDRYADTRDPRSKPEDRREIIALRDALEAEHAARLAAEAALAAEHEQRMGDVESWTHWRNKYEEDTYSLRSRVQALEAALRALVDAAYGAGSTTKAVYAAIRTAEELLP